MSLTFQPFTALGVGNGFPFCAIDLDVTGFDLVAPMTLEQAMKFYWLHGGVTGSAEANQFNPDFYPPITASSVTSEQLPVSRVCGSKNFASEGGSGGDDEAGFYGASISMGRISGLPGKSTNSLRRLFQGGNFVGYGLSSEDGYLARAHAFNIDVIEAFVELRFGVESESASSDFDYAEVTVGNLPFVAIAYGKESRDASALEAQTGTGNLKLEASITGLQFYELE
jgi:hypothetical protein